ncbi:glycosyltransferase family 2 protein [Vibrio cyclitrophicus]
MKTLSNPKISIITIAFNAYSDGLEKTIESVVKQKNDSIEYIIIDGGSNDLSHDVYKKYHESVDYFISEKDKGISDAFNKGVRASKGDYIWFLNAGDYLNDYAVEHVENFIEKHQQSIIYGDMFWVENRKISLLCPSESYEDKIRYVMPFLHPSTIVKKTIFQDVGYFDTSLKRAMDYDLLVRAYLSQHRAIKIDFPLAFMTAGGVHDSDYLKTLKEVMHVSTRNGAKRYIALLALIYTYLNKKSDFFVFIKKKLRGIR